MTTGEKFEELKKKDIAAKSDRERMVIDKELEQLANNDQITIWKVLKPL